MRGQISEHKNYTVVSPSDPLTLMSFSSPLCSSTPRSIIIPSTASNYLGEPILSLSTNS